MDDSYDFENDPMSINDCEYLDLDNQNIDFNNNVLHLNIRSLQNKVHEIENLISLLKFPRVFALSETWLKSNNVLISISNYSFISSHRICGAGGGVAMYIHKDVHYNVVDKSCNHNDLHKIDYILTELVQYNIFLCCMYCPPKTDLNVISHLINDLKMKTNHKSNFLITGDFNVNLLDITSCAINDFLNELHSHSLHPIINLPTRVTDFSATLIDNFFCDFSLLPAKSCVIRTDVSDHYLISYLLKNNNNISELKTRNFSTKNKIIFSQKLLSSDWNHLYTIKDVDKVFSYFIKKLKRIYNKCFPFISVPSKNNKPPWISLGLVKSIRHKNILYKQTKTNLNLRPKYIAYRNKLTKLMRIAKQNYYKNILITFKNKSAKLWSHLNSLIKSKEKNQIPIKPNVLNDFFVSVFKQAPNYVSKFKMPANLIVQKSLYLSPITLDEIINTMCSLSNSRSVGSDNLNPLLIKENIIYIARQLEYIFNLSFSSGIFPNLLKNAIITPVFKSGSTSEPGNYRPISILTIFSKLLEKLFYNRLIAFVNKNSILHPHQFGFRTNYNTNYALAHVISSIVDKINKNKRVILTLLDLKKAFDLINHKLLLEKMSFYGIRGMPLQWLSSYLTDRTQKTKVNDVLSDKKSISAGVPQGSTLSSLLFILFINDVFQFNSINVEIFLYADDTAIIFSADDDHILQSIINNFFFEYCAWCNSNCIVLNPIKSNYLSFNNTNVTVSINNQLLENPIYAKYLGVYIDNRLFWNYHVDFVLKRCCQRIGLFKKVIPYLSKYAIQLYYSAFIVSCFSYCIVYWFNNDRSGKCKLINKVNNLVTYLVKRNLCFSDSLACNIMLCSSVHKLQCLALMHDIYNNKIFLPTFSPILNNMVHKYNTRSSDNFHINSITSLDRRNFMYHCILFWNEANIESRKLSKPAFLHACKLLI